LGDHEPVGSGVYEMRVHTGPGYRVYYTIHKNKIIFLLHGGTSPPKRKMKIKPRLWLKIYRRRI
jgi:putative addiction module killer protein